jgi:hypothetical protein
MASRPLAVLSSCLLLAVSMGASPADAGKADGSMTINGKTTKLAYAYARLDTDSFDKKSTLVVITISEKPLAPADVADDFGLMKLDHRVNALIFKIDKDKQVVSGEIDNVALETGSMAVTGVHEFEPTVFTNTHVTGKMYMKAAAKFFETTYQYSVTFDVAVAPKK